MRILKVSIHKEPELVDNFSYIVFNKSRRNADAISKYFNYYTLQLYRFST